MLEHLVSFWEKYPNPFLGALAVLDVFLFFVVGRSLGALKKNKTVKAPLIPQEAIPPPIEIKEEIKTEVAAPVPQSPIVIPKDVEFAAEKEEPVRAERKAIQTFEKEELKDIDKVKRDIKRSAIRNIVIKDKAKIFEMKRQLDDKDDVISLYAFRAIAKADAQLIDEATLLKALQRAEKKKVLMISNFIIIAEGGNPQVLTKILNAESPAWIYIAALNVLYKTHYPELSPVLAAALTHPSDAVKECANIILEEKLSEAA